MNRYALEYLFFRLYSFVARKELLDLIHSLNSNYLEYNRWQKNPPRNKRAWKKPFGILPIS